MVSKAPLSDNSIIDYAFTHRDLAYLILCYSWPRADTPENLAPRFQRTLEALSRVNPAFGDWQVQFLERMELLPLASLSFADIVQSIREGVGYYEDDVTPNPTSGYSFGANTGQPANRRGFSLSIEAGSTSAARRFPNIASLESYPLCPENASLLTLDVLKPALLVLISEWEPTWCGLKPRGSSKIDYEIFMKHKARYVGLQWVTYMQPRFAAMVTPPASAITEYLPDGGLLMIATEDRFDVDNPHHLAVASDIEAALDPVNAQLWWSGADPAR